MSIKINIKNFSSHLKKTTVLRTFLGLIIPVVGTVMTDAPTIWPVSVLIYNLGLLYCFALAPPNIVKLVLYNVLASILFVFEAAFFFSFYLQNAGFNEAFFYHLRPDLLYAGVSEFLPALILLTSCLLVFLFISSTWLTRQKPVRLGLAPFAFGLLIFGFFISPPVQSLSQYIQKISSEDTDNVFVESFNKLSDTKVTINFSKKKKANIVLIYAESLDQRYFDEDIFPGLLPNLKELREQSIDFTNVAQGIGAEWTIAGMVASQCAYPLTSTYGMDTNVHMFDHFLPRATCLGDLLEKDGYHLTFMGGADARFGGKGDFLTAHGYKEVLDLYDFLGSLSNKSYLNPWGLYDDTLLGFAYEKFISLSDQESPFLLTLLTVDTHHPRGYLSRSCGSYKTGDNSSLNSIHCTDQLISMFVNRIRNSAHSKNTVIIVLSDHLAMRNQASALLASSQKPNRLAFYINTPDSKVEKNKNPGTHYDIAPTILDLVGYDVLGQMGFGSPLTRGPGYLPGKFGEDGWKKHAPELMAIGKTLWNNDVTLDQTGIKFTAANLSYEMGGREFNLRSFNLKTNDPLLRADNYSTQLASIPLFIFDAKSFKLESIKTFPSGTSRGIISKTLLENKEKLALMISPSAFLPGLAGSRNHPKQWVVFFGKPGSDLFYVRPLTGDFMIPFDLVIKLKGGKVAEEPTISQREIILNTFAKK